MDTDKNSERPSYLRQRIGKKERGKREKSGERRRGGKIGEKKAARILNMPARLHVWHP